MAAKRFSGGHAHFWERALSRRAFLNSSAFAGAAAATSPIWVAKLVEAQPFAQANPKHIPGGTLLPFQPTPFHFFFPTPGVPGAVTIQSGHGDPSLIFDFDGMVGMAEVGLGQGTSTLDGRRLFWAADARFMKGTYIGTDGDTRTGAFAFL